MGGHEVDVGKGVPPTMGSSRGSPNVEGDPLSSVGWESIPPFHFKSMGGNATIERGYPLPSRERGVDAPSPILCV